MTDTSLRCRLRLHRWCPGDYVSSDGDGTLAPVLLLTCQCRCHRKGTP